MSNELVMSREELTKQIAFLEQDLKGAYEAFLKLQGALDLSREMLKMLDAQSVSEGQDIKTESGEVIDIANLDSAVLED